MPRTRNFNFFQTKYQKFDFSIKLNEDATIHNFVLIRQGNQKSGRCSLRLAQLRAANNPSKFTRAEGEHKLVLVHLKLHYLLKAVVLRVCNLSFEIPSLNKVN